MVGLIASLVCFTGLTEVSFRSQKSPLQDRILFTGFRNGASIPIASSSRFENVRPGSQSYKGQTDLGRRASEAVVALE